MAVTTGRPELADALDRLWPGYQSVLAGLIRIPSLLGDEAAAQRYLAAAAADAGMDVELWDVDPGELSADPDYAAADGGAVVRPNLTAVLPGTGGGRSIAVSGHVDVVPLGPARMWTRDPWGAAVEDGRMYGRGTLDMKGGLVAGLLAIQAVRECYGALPGDIVFESVIEEECTGNGTLAARRHGPDVGRGAHSRGQRRGRADRQPGRALVRGHRDRQARLRRPGRCVGQRDRRRRRPDGGDARLAR